MRMKSNNFNQLTKNCEEPRLRFNPYPSNTPSTLNHKERHFPFLCGHWHCLLASAISQVHGPKKNSLNRRQTPHEELKAQSSSMGVWNFMVHKAWFPKIATRWNLELADVPEGADCLLQLNKLSYTAKL